MGLFKKQQPADQRNDDFVFYDEATGLSVVEEDDYLRVTWTDELGPHELWRYPKDKVFLEHNFWDADDYLALLRGQEARLASPTAIEIQAAQDEYDLVHVDNWYGALIYQDWQHQYYLVAQEGLVEPDTVAYEMTREQFKQLTNQQIDISALHHDLKHGR